MTLDISPTFTWNETVWNPSMIQTALWLDAADANTITESGGAVSQWNDKSGNSRSASQGNAAFRPIYSPTVYNGLGGLVFDGVNDNLAVNYSYAGNQATLIAVVSRLPGGDSEQWVFSSYDGAVGTPLVAPMWVLGAETPQWSTYGGSPLTFAPGGVTVTTDGTPYILEIVSDITNSILDCYTNGTRTAQYSSGARFTGGGNRAYIGAEVNGASRFLSGRVHEIIQAENVLTTTDRQKLEGYLAHKWGLAANLPADHPYKNYGPRP